MSDEQNIQNDAPNQGAQGTFHGDVNTGTQNSANAQGDNSGQNIGANAGTANQNNQHGNRVEGGILNYGNMNVNIINQNPSEQKNEDDQQQQQPAAPPPPANAPESSSVRFSPCDYFDHFVMDATAEGNLLSRVFVPPRGYDFIRGQVSHKYESRFIFGKPGYGKTAICRDLSTTNEKDVLTVLFDDLSVLQSPERETRISFDIWAFHLRRSFLKALQQRLNRTRVRKLQNNPVAGRCWVVYALSSIEEPKDIDEPINRKELEARCQAYSALDWFEVLRDIARAAGFTQVRMLIDDINGELLTSNPTSSGHLLQPLLDKVGSLQTFGFAFKFFLPAALQEEKALRKYQDKVPSTVLEWSEQELHKILSNRLQQRNPSRSNNEGTPPQSFANLCIAQLPFDVDERLVQKADGSPRELLRLARDIIEHHCTHNRSAPKIEADTITAVLNNSVGFR